MKFGVIGYKGRMGKLILEVFQQKGHQAVLLVEKDEEKFYEKPEVIIDFSAPEAIENTINLGKKFNSKLVIGTTGLNKQKIDLLKEASQNIAVIQSYNFSIGINIILEILEKYSKLFSAWDCEIIETHHSMKKDKPSGTALLLKKSLNREVLIHSLRIGNIPGDHTILFSNDGELINISHRAISRNVFAIGALKAAEWIITKKSGLFTFRDIIKEELL
ncbi:MAG: 4-hydroxy-tetrahydrodipicolinate reductase [Thermosipho sp. (in: Bacteria)]|nr:4-hydroxy-tetrahydrodipicolinate reductase [Thermosipho sp. (in: thermotogales)]